MKQIFLGGKHGTLVSGRYALVSDKDYAVVSSYSWTCWKIKRTFYASHSWWNTYRQATEKILMHRMVRPDLGEVDHICGNGLDNRRSNLRNGKHANKLNRQAIGKSRFKGVYRHNAKFWRVKPKLNGVVYDLGLFLDEEDAAHAYDAMARVLFGAFGTYNFPRQGERPAIRTDLSPCVCHSLTGN